MFTADSSTDAKYQVHFNIVLTYSLFEVQLILTQIGGLHKGMTVTQPVYEYFIVYVDIELNWIST